LLFGKHRSRLFPALGLLCGLALHPSLATAHPAPNESPSASHSRHHSTRSPKSRTKSKRLHRSSWRHHGQQVIDTERARQIQQALIRNDYLDGEATGSWDERTRQAMQHYQQANGWQTRVVPDSRALIKLGLGPSSDGLLNPDTAMAPSAPPPAAAQNFTGTPQR
jgi:peptidoglycan hydrolase-like protein with peptidoglycan-binding domain